MSNIIFANNLEIDITIQQEWLDIVNVVRNNAYYYLSSFRNDAGYTEKLQTAFGNDFDSEVANQLFDGFAQGNFSGIPTIEIVNRNDINGANGAFAIATGKIYLAADFISQNTQNLDAIVAVLLEETGHYIDAKINVADAAGDEGDIFARLVQGKSLREHELAVLQAEDDTTTVTLEDEEIEIEMSRTEGDIRYFTVNSGEELWADGGYEGFLGSWVWNFKPQVKGSDGNDTIHGSNDLSKTTYLFGNNGNDIIYGTGAAEFIYGGQGNDTIYSNGGPDNIDPGYSQYSTDIVDARLQDLPSSATLAADYISKDNGHGIHLGYDNPEYNRNAIYSRGGDGNKQLVEYFNIKRFVITGTQYDDVFEVLSHDINGWGDNIFKGGLGNDIFNLGYNHATVTVDGGAGYDTLGVNYSSKNNGYGIHLGYDNPEYNRNAIYSRGGDGAKFELVKYSSIEKFSIIGTEYDDIFQGGDNADIFDGGAGNDQINGGGGDDELYAGRFFKSIEDSKSSGRDVLVGGSGMDTFYMFTLSPRVPDSSKEAIEENIFQSDTLWSSIKGVKNIIAGLIAIAKTQPEWQLAMLLVVEVGDIILDAIKEFGIEDVISNPPGEAFGSDEWNELVYIKDFNIQEGNSFALPLDNDYHFTFLDASKSDPDDGYKLKPGTLITHGNGKEVAFLYGVNKNQLEPQLSLKNEQIIFWTGNPKKQSQNESSFVFKFGGEGNDLNSGGSGDDYLYGGTGSDELKGGDGNDILDPGFSSGSTDTVDGGAGNDVIRVNYTSKNDGAGIHVRYLGSNNIFSRANGNQPIVTISNVENYDITGTQYNDVFEANNGNDTYSGGAGSDVLNGGDGNDILNPGYSPYSTDTVDGGEGDDLLQVDYSSKSNGVGIHLGYNGEYGTNVIYHRNGNNGDNYKLVQFSSIERFDITGTNYDDAFEGRTGNDIFNGGAGNDRLTGGTGKDTLTGGAGSDRFDYRNLADSLLNSFDVITDFNPTAGNDLFLVSTARSELSNAGTVATLNATGIAANLTTANFGSNSAAQFNFGSRAFVAINDATAGFNANSDAIIEVTGFTGTLGFSNFIIV
ncbi:MULTISPECIES: calcium-binding protein [Nostoc]|uniref:Calcium-binding protein n=2 Tax=Nostoc TaxID=1177 RepID=A0ABR8IEP2_9NOSO|nr:MULTISPECIES: calcium-binding protein [Nostoc]MBD2564933.1 hypothetical protein [Nostoc linckia FACHB-391]MBD2649271.1 hypothetical protein [Nostoc foliaceum FACHB-393]